jgi:pimeloyl-ACP methyl ester carboxylesterase
MGRLTFAVATVIGVSLVPLNGKVAAPTAPGASITTIPIQVVQTTDGAVSYRSDGTGTPLVLIMGWQGTQDDWPPDLVDALAAQHQVIIFDNAGTGQTSMPTGALTISAMADQTAALIQALNLGKPAVLGWSMGGMIAQALAVRHPADLGRLVLAGTFLGNGTAVLGPGAPTIGAELFPPDQVATQFPAYEAEIETYPSGYFTAGNAVVSAQLGAIDNWAAGGDPGGYGSIKVHTLIGDGADDVLTPPVNSYALRKAIHGSVLHIYPDAGHGFQFQDASAWSTLVNRFLAK